jgi:hypothetical protein
MTFRPPIIVGIARARFAAQVDYVVNLNLVLHFPNPTRPWAQYDWPRPTDLPKLKAVGEPIGRVNPVLTPNPTRPWSQYDWPSAVRVPLSLKSDSYWGGSPLYYPNPPQPFVQSDWLRAPALPKAIGEAVSGDAPLLTPNPARPYAQADWPSIRSTLKAKVDDFVNLLPFQVVVAVSPPFQQNLWDNAARIAVKATGEGVSGNSPLLTPNPPAPFTQADWPSVVSKRPAAIIDTSAQAILVTTAAFQQTEWFQAPPPLWKAKVDDLTNLVPLYSVVVAVAPPFYQNLWDSAARIPPTATGEATTGNAPLLTPNPAQPFNQSDWLRAPFAVKVKTDEAINLLPLQSGAPIIVPAPFTQADWPLPYRPNPASAGGDPSLALLSLLYAVQPRPFVQTDWQTPRYSSAGSRSGAVGGQSATAPETNTDWLMRARRRGLR